MATVLVVEDDVISRYTLAEWLRFEGYEVLEAMSADEAVVIFASILSIDLVVTDIEMPGSMNGLDLAEQIKARFPALPVIVVSGKPFIDKLGIGTVTEFFPKPYDLSKLTAYIATLVPPNKAGPEKLKQASDE
jgi:CheY-like chemotaxis protein